MNGSRGFTLIEILVAIGIMAVIMGIAAGPFVSWYKRSRLEDKASTMHETFKFAQTQAMKLGENDMVGGKLVRQRIYIAANEDEGKYRVIRWKDQNADGVKSADEFTLLQEESLAPARFGKVATVDKKACSNTSGAPASNIVNLTATNCPGGIDLFPGYQCARFDGKGFFSESMKNAAIYLTNGIDSYAVSLNPAGVMTLCRWNGVEWQYVR